MGLLNFLAIGLFCVFVIPKIFAVCALVFMNLLGPLGIILGIFLVGFMFKRVTGSSSFYAALISESIVLYMYFYTQVGFLWFNVFGSLMVIGFSFAIQMGKNAWQKTIKM